MVLLGAINSGMFIGGKFGILIGILVGVVVLVLSFGRKHDPAEHEEEPSIQPEELTPEENKKEGLKMMGCLLIFLVIALITILWIV